MIRSLIAHAGLEPDATSVKLRRNVKQESLAEAFAQKEMLWLDISDTSIDELKWLENLLNLHPEVVDNLSKHNSRPALMIYPHYLFVTLFEPHLTTVDHRHGIHADEIHCLIGDHFFITVRMGNSGEVNEAYNRMAQQNADAWRNGVSYLLYLTMQYVVDAYYPIIDRISLRLSELEEQVLSDAFRRQDVQRQVYRIKQQLISLRRMVAPQREVLSSAFGTSRLTQSEEERDLFRHLYERLLRVYDVIDSQRDLSSNILDLIQNYEASRLSVAVSRLTIISMIFLPLTLVAALLELNFVTPESPTIVPISGAVALVLLVAAMVLAAIGLAWFFRRRGWL